MDELERGIIPLFIGGLGNQMFIVSAAFTVQQTIQCPLYLLQSIPSKNPHNKSKYNNNFNKTIFKHFGQHLPFTNNSMHNLRSLNYKGTHTDATLDIACFERWSPELIEPGTILNSFFQYYPPLKPFENELRNLYLKGLEGYRSKLGDYSGYAFLHIRRGDYLILAIHNLSIDYYRDAVSNLQEKGISKYIVLSDDTPWVKEQEYFKDPKFEIFESDDELLAMALMSKCTAGAICANSTFSWWGAFLGAHGVRAPVIVPKTWIGGGKDLPDLCPEEWIHI